MIVGTVDARRQSIVPPVVRGMDGQQETVETLLDTGFNGELMLPAARVTALGLTPRSSRVMRLADGRSFPVPHSELVAIAGRTVVVTSPQQDESYSVIDSLLIVSLDFAAFVAPPGGNGEKK